MPRLVPSGGVGVEDFHIKSETHRDLPALGTSTKGPPTVGVESELGITG